MRLSVLVPVFNEQGSLLLLHKKLELVLSQLPFDHEIVYIDDGSGEKSQQKWEDIGKTGKNVKIISLRRNYGQTQAIAAGVNNAKGEIIIIIDADLQNDPDDIPRILAKFDEGYDVVSGWRKKRKDALLLKKIPSAIANSVIALITGVKIHDLGCALKAYRYEVLKGIEFHGEIHRLLPLYAAMQGFKITELPVKHYKRRYGKSKYGLARFFKIILDMFALMFMWKFLDKPIYAFGGVGIVSLLISFIIGLFIVLRKLFFAGVWVSPLLFVFVLFFLIAIQFILMGILAEFIIRLYNVSRNRNRYKIKGRE